METDDMDKKIKEMCNLTVLNNRNEIHFYLHFY